MEDLLGNALPSQLLFMMGLIVGSAILLMAVMIFSLVNRNKNSAPKLSFPPKESMPFSSDKAEELDISILARSKAILPTAVMMETKIKPPAPIMAENNNQAISEPAPPIELLRLWRDPMGQLIVEIANQRYTKLAEISDKEIGQYILRLAAHFLAFTNGIIVTDGGAKSLSCPKVGLVPRPQFSTMTTAVKKTVASRGGQTDLITEPMVAPPPTGFNLADEINGFVQARLAHSSLAKTTKIKIFSNRKGGIEIEVNGTGYSSPDEIPQLEIKTLLKDEIREWENS